ncbi:MAG: right-handed parallel beta-helix repeat-containing protein [Candidatus Lokiarchaeia archaeon]
MKKIVKRKTILLITFGILFTLSLSISNNLNYNKGTRDKIADNENLKISIVSGPIHIDDNDPSINWSVAEAAGICTGKGTYSEPYVIEDLVIDGGGSGSGILIENSIVFFRIENCTVYNSGDPHSSDAGIRLDRASNGSIIENNCSNNIGNGISLRNMCKNNTISRNVMSDNGASGIVLSSGCNNNTIWDNLIYGSESNGIVVLCNDNVVKENNVSDCKNGIYLDYSDNNEISGNIANNNTEYGIYLHDEANNNTISNNTVNDNQDSGIFVEYKCHNNVISGNTANYNNNWGIYLYLWCTLNTISGNTVNNNTRGIGFIQSSYNNVSGNNVNYNDDYGISLASSNNLTISGNTASYNGDYGIYLDFSNNNIEISGNIMDECGLVIKGGFFIIDTSNLVNGKPLYYYVNEINLGPSNFTNAGQVILVNCKDSLISNLNVSYCSFGISLYSCNNNTISGNTANYNEKGIDLRASDFNIISGNTANYNEKGIDLYLSDFNTISGNSLIGNQVCWGESTCENNTFENNDCGYYQQPIPGYDLFLIIGVISIVSAIMMKKQKSK